MSEHYNTFTAYDYPSKRNRKIGLVRKMIILTTLVIGWAIICYFMSWSVPQV